MDKYFFYQGGMRGKRVKQLEGKIRRGGKLVFSLPAFGGNLTKEGNRGNGLASWWAT